MDMKKAMLAAMQEYLLPELQEIKSGQARLETELNAINKRLDDVNLHLADQSRRIDSVREELGSRIDETNNRIDAVREELGSRIDETNNRIDTTNNRIDTTNNRIDAVREELNQGIAATNRRLDNLYEVIVRRDEHSALVIKIGELDKDVREIKQRLAA